MFRFSIFWNFHLFWYPMHRQVPHQQWTGNTPDPCESSREKYHAEILQFCQCGLRHHRHSNFLDMLVTLSCFQTLHTKQFLVSGFPKTSTASQRLLSDLSVLSGQRVDGSQQLSSPSTVESINASSSKDLTAKTQKP